MIKIHFICRGNVLRSLIAETYLRSLMLPNIVTTSSGTNVDLSSEEERGFFARTIKLCTVHGIAKFAKSTSDQLTQERANDQDIIVCMNQRVASEAAQQVVLPDNTLDCGIVDIGEGHRTAIENTKQYEEEIFQEIVAKVDELVVQLSK